MARQKPRYWGFFVFGLTVQNLHVNYIISAKKGLNMNRRIHREALDRANEYLSGAEDVLCFSGMGKTGRELLRSAKGSLLLVQGSASRHKPEQLKELLGRYQETYRRMSLWHRIMFRLGR